MTGCPTTCSADQTSAIRASRRHPAITQFDYLHVRALVRGLEDAIARAESPIENVLDVWCGSRPYDDLLPPGARCVGLDVEGNPYGVADVVSNELLPFADESFDLVMCVQAFQYMAEPGAVVAEFERILRPGGTVLVSLVFGYEYDRRSTFEARYTEHELRTLFSGWENVIVREDGGRTVSWTVLTGSLLYGVEQRAKSLPAQRLLRLAFASSYALVNTIGRVAQRAEETGEGAAALPMNLTLTARKRNRD